MPALRTGSYRWHIASDDVPVFAVFGALFHGIWVLLIAITGQDVLAMPRICHHAGTQYIAVVGGLLGAFSLGLVCELVLVWKGCRGAPHSRRPIFLLAVLCVASCNVMHADAQARRLSPPSVVHMSVYLLARYVTSVFEAAFTGALPATAAHVLVPPVWVHTAQIDPVAYGALGVDCVQSTAHMSLAGRTCAARCPRWRCLIRGRRSPSSSA